MISTLFRIPWRFVALVKAMVRSGHILPVNVEQDFHRDKLFWYGSNRCYQYIIVTLINV